MNVSRLFSQVSRTASYLPRRLHAPCPPSSTFHRSISTSASPSASASPSSPPSTTKTRPPPNTANPRSTIMAETQPKITLHWLNGSRAQGTMWLLEELKLPYELKIYYRQKNLSAPAELSRIHPLGKSPTVTIAMPPGAPSQEPLVLAEGPFIVQYLTDHFAAANNPTLVPARWREGQEGKLNGETAAWMRYSYLLYYAEGSFMAALTTFFVFDAMKGPQVPFLLRPLTRLVAHQLIAAVSYPNLSKQFAMLEGFLGDSEGDYLCGKHLTGADIALGFPLVAAREFDFDQLGKWEKGSFKAQFPRLVAYMQRLADEPGWKLTVEKIKEREGKFTVLP